MRIDPHVVGRHQAAGGVFLIFRQLAQLDGTLRLHRREQLFLLCFGEIAEQIGGIVGVHLLDDVGRAFGADFLDDRLLHVGLEMFERVGSGFVVEVPDDTRRVVRREIADDLGEIGGMQSRQLSLRNGKANVGRREIVDRRDVVPRNHASRNAVEDGCRKSIGAESAQQAGKTDVGRNDAQGSARARDLDVVDTNELTAFDVDDLLVE